LLVHLYGRLALAIFDVANFVARVQLVRIQVLQFRCFNGFPREQLPFAFRALGFDALLGSLQRGDILQQLLQL
jgi:hypothetical protein